MGNVIANSGDLLRHLVSPGLWSSRAPFALLPNYAIGVRHPQNDFEYDPLTVAAPDDPAEWPSAEATGFYYIDNTHGSATDSNTYGYPDAPRLTIPEQTYTLANGDRQVYIHAGSYGPFSGGNALNVVLIGNTANPFFFRGNPTTPPQFNGRLDMTDSFNAVIDNIDHDSTGESQFGVWLRRNNSYITMRNFECFDDGTAKGATSLIKVGVESISVAQRNSYIVAYNLNIHDFGDNSGVAEDDAIAFGTGEGYDYFWCIGNTVARCGADAINPGQNTAQQTPPYLTNRPTNTYIAKNTFSDNGENGVDVKSSDKTIVSQNTIHTMIGSASSAGEAIVCHESCTDVFIIANRLYDCGIGIVASQNGEVTALNNVIHDMDSTKSNTTPEAGYAFNSRGLESIFSNNTVVRCGGGARAEGSQVFEVMGNTFSERTVNAGTAGSFDIRFNLSDVSDKTENYNHFDDFEASVGGTTYSTVAAYEAALPTLGGNEQEGAAVFVDSVNDDFQPDTGSPLIANGYDSIGYANFESIFGIDIRKDFNDVTRPATNTDWAIGSQEPA